MIKIIANSTLLHKIYSKFIRLVPTFFIHNNSKYLTIKKTLFNLWIDGVKGDLIEFGVFTGSSFRHTIKTEYDLDKESKSMFYGLDSFEGFPESDHEFFKKSEYSGKYEKVKRYEKIKPDYIHIVKGFFTDSLKSTKLQNVEQLKFVNIDCDLYVSSIEPIKYIKPRLVNGAYIMIDDFTNIDKNGKNIRNVFYEEFKNSDYQITGYFGIDGVLIRYFGEKD